MAQKNAASEALKGIDATINEVAAGIDTLSARLSGLKDARILLAAAMHDEDDPVASAPKARKPRGPNKKRGLPATEAQTQALHDYAKASAQ